MESDSRVRKPYLYGNGIGATDCFFSIHSRRGSCLIILPAKLPPLSPRQGPQSPYMLPPVACPISLCERRIIVGNSDSDVNPPVVVGLSPPPYFFLSRGGQRPWTTTAAMWIHQ
jgi:hypothetical protein